jgi:hypothetical protein
MHKDNMEHPVFELAVCPEKHAPLMEVERIARASESICAAFSRLLEGGASG